MDTLINSKVQKIDDGIFGCTDCDYQAKQRHHVRIHIESKHIDSGGYTCLVCMKRVPTRNALKVHQKRNHNF